MADAIIISVFMTDIAFDASICINSSGCKHFASYLDNDLIVRHFFIYFFM